MTPPGVERCLLNVIPLSSQSDGSLLIDFPGRELSDDQPVDQAAC
jgi:hypothetical protein